MGNIFGCCNKNNKYADDTIVDEYAAMGTRLKTGTLTAQSSTLGRQNNKITDEIPKRSQDPNLGEVNEAVEQSEDTFGNDN